MRSVYLRLVYQFGPNAIRDKATASETVDPSVAGASTGDDLWQRTDKERPQAVLFPDQLVLRHSLT